MLTAMGSRVVHARCESFANRVERAIRMIHFNANPMKNNEEKPSKKWKSVFPAENRSRYEERPREG